MQLDNCTPVSAGQRRTAFTLIELLVVIAIIGILSALSAAAVIKYMGTQQINVTQQRVNTVGSQMNKAWKTVAQNAWNVDPSKYPSTVNWLQWANNDPKRARVMYVKCVLKQTFPTSFAEALNPYPMPALPAYLSYLGPTGLGFTLVTPPPQGQMNPPNPPAPYESSACLLMALQRGVSSMSLNVEDLGVSATADFQAGNSTIKALVDSWGQPLIFCRWPTGNPMLNPSGPWPGITNDPGDPQGLLAAGPWRNSNGGQNLANFQTYLHPLPGATGQSFKLVPLLASAGPDQFIGPSGDIAGYLNSYPFTMTPDPNYPGRTDDNIYSQH